MKLIIDIPEKTFEYYVTLANKGEQIGNLERIILDGKPYTMVSFATDGITDADTILEANKEGKE